MERWQPSSETPPSLILHIQDLHIHAEAQSHISQLIDDFRKQLGVRFVALEGAEGLCDTSLYSDLPDPPSTERIARLFLHEGLFTGAEYYAITHPGSVTLWGVEDEATYLEHLESYQQGAQSSARADALLERLRNPLTRLRARLYPQTLRRLFALREAYDRGSRPEGFWPYVTELQRLARATKIDLSAFPHLSTLAQARRLSRHLDMREVSADRDRLIRDLWPRVSESARRALTLLAESWAARQVTEASYDRGVVDLATRHGVEFSLMEANGQSGVSGPFGPRANGWSIKPQRAYHALHRYLTYLELTQRAQMGVALRELDAIARAVEEAYATTPRQRALQELLERLAILDELFHTTLSPEHFQAYAQHREAYTASALWRALTYVFAAAPPVSQAELVAFFKELPAQQRFYELALQRDAALVNNMLRQFTGRSESAAVLIAGGFHTPGITRRLRERGTAYLVIAPTFSDPTDDVRYQDRLKDVLPPLTDLIDALDRQALNAGIASSVKSSLKAWFRATPPVAGIPPHAEAQGPISKFVAVALHFLSLKIRELLRQFGAQSEQVRRLVDAVQHHPQAVAAGITLDAVADTMRLSARGSPDAERIDLAFDAKTGELRSAGSVGLTLNTGASDASFGSPGGSRAEPEGMRAGEGQPAGRDPQSLTDVFRATIRDSALSAWLHQAISALMQSPVLFVGLAILGLWWMGALPPGSSMHHTGADGMSPVPMPGPWLFAGVLARSWGTGKGVRQATAFWRKRILLDAILKTRGQERDWITGIVSARQLDILKARLLQRSWRQLVLGLGGSGRNQRRSELRALGQFHAAVKRRFPRIYERLQARLLHLDEKVRLINTRNLPVGQAMVPLFDLSPQQLGELLTQPSQRELIRFWAQEGAKGVMEDIVTLFRQDPRAVALLATEHQRVRRVVAYVLNHPRLRSHSETLWLVIARHRTRRIQELVPLSATASDAMEHSLHGELLVASEELEKYERDGRLWVFLAGKILSVLFAVGLAVLTSASVAEAAQDAVSASPIGTISLLSVGLGLSVLGIMGVRLMLTRSLRHLVWHAGLNLSILALAIGVIPLPAWQPTRLPPTQSRDVSLPSRGAETLAAQLQWRLQSWPTSDLIGQLADSESGEVREALARVLEERRDPASIDPLGQLLNLTRDADLKARVILLLGVLGQRRAVQWLDAAAGEFQGTREADDQLRLRALATAAFLTHARRAAKPEERILLSLVEALAGFEDLVGSSLSVERLNAEADGLRGWLSGLQARVRQLAPLAGLIDAPRMQALANKEMPDELEAYLDVLQREVGSDGRAIRAIVEAIMRTESSLRAGARSAQGAVGLMGLKLEAFVDVLHDDRDLANELAKMFGGVLSEMVRHPLGPKGYYLAYLSRPSRRSAPSVEAFTRTFERIAQDPVLNIMIGWRYFQIYIQYYRDRGLDEWQAILMALAVYNGGIGHVDRFVFPDYFAKDATRLGGTVPKRWMPTITTFEELLALKDPTTGSPVLKPETQEYVPKVAALVMLALQESRDVQVKALEPVAFAPLAEQTRERLQAAARQWQREQQEERTRQALRRGLGVRARPHQAAPRSPWRSSRGASPPVVLAGVGLTVMGALLIPVIHGIAGVLVGVAIIGVGVAVARFGEEVLQRFLSHRAAQQDASLRFRPDAAEPEHVLFDQAHSPAEGWVSEEDISSAILDPMRALAVALLDELETRGLITRELVASGATMREEIAGMLLGAVDNAVEATTSRWRPQFARSEIRVRAAIRGNALWIQVIDNGTGLSRRALSSVGKWPMTTKTGRGAAQRSVAGGGEGEHLYNASGAAELLGGRLEVRNRSGARGAIVSFVFPLRRPASTPPSPLPPPRQDVVGQYSTRLASTSLHYSQGLAITQDGTNRTSSLAEGPDGIRQYLAGRGPIEHVRVAVLPDVWLTLQIPQAHRYELMGDPAWTDERMAHLIQVGLLQHLARADAVLTAEDIKALVHTPLFFAITDTSPHLWNDHLANGAIFMNRALLKLKRAHGIPGAIADAHFASGFSHEFIHEATGRGDDPAFERQLGAVDQETVTMLLRDAVVWTDFGAVMVGVDHGVYQGLMHDLLAEIPSGSHTPSGSEGGPGPAEPGSAVPADKTEAGSSPRRTDGGPTFLTGPEIHERLTMVLDQLQAAIEERAQHTPTPLNIPELQTMLRALIHQHVAPEGDVASDTKGLAGIAILDYDAGLTPHLYSLLGSPHVAPLVAHGLTAARLMEGLIFDHHGVFYDREKPFINSTMLLLDRIEQLLREPGTEREKVTRLTRAFQIVSTDNLGDGALALWILHHLEAVAADETLRRMLERVAWVEDFGVFSGRLEQVIQGDAALRAASEIDYAILNTYDTALHAHKIDGSDRFGHLAAEAQRALVSDVLGAMTRCFDDPAFRRDSAEAFRSAIETAKERVPFIHAQLVEQSKAVLAREGLDVHVLENVYVVSEDALPAGRFFANSIAMPYVHSLPRELRFRSLGQDALGHARTQLVLAVPEGRTAESLQPLGAWIHEANLRKAARLDLPPEIATGAVSGRDAIQVAFRPGLLLSPEEILIEVARFYHLQDKEGPGAESTRKTP